jgi:hypothetical protein
MGNADNYRRYAAECIRLAHQLQDPAETALLLRMARIWQRLAERAVNKADDDGEAN